MHALTSTAYGDVAPRVWLLTRPMVPRPAKIETSRGNRILHPLIVSMLFALAAIAMLVTMVMTRGVQLFVIDGDGLQPSIPSGSLIVVEPVGGRALAVGEIVTMTDSYGALKPGYISEVVRGEDGLHYNARAIGDALGESRSITGPDGLGRVALFIPGASDVLVIATGTVGRAVAAGLALLVILWRTLPLISRGRKARRSRERQIRSSRSMQAG